MYVVPHSERRSNGKALICPLLLLCNGFNFLWRFNRHATDLSQDSQFIVGGAVHTMGDVECSFVSVFAM